MKLKPALILVTSLTACSFQTQASLCNGGFEDGLTCWGGLTEEFGFKEVIPSYTDGRGITFTPTEGSFFLNLWGNNDIAQRFSWQAGDQISFDWAEAPGTRFPRISLFAALFNGISLEERLNLSVSDTTTFSTFNHTFTQDSSALAFGSSLVFQAQGVMPYVHHGITNEEVGHILIDNVQFTTASDPDSAVPEPDTAFLMGIAMLFGLCNRIARKRPIQKIGL